MYLAHIEVENFRIFGSRQKNRHCAIDLDPGLNVVVGENDSGKTCLVDAIRYLVGTVTDDFCPISEEDFHCDDSGRAAQLRITGEFRGLNTDECGALLEYLSVKKTAGGNEFFLKIWMDASLTEAGAVAARRSRVQCEFRAGTDEEGKEFRGACRQLLRATYLKPLRDAIAELTAKRGSRLSRVLRAYPQIKGHDQPDWQPEVPDATPRTLVGIMRKTEHALRATNVVQSAEKDLNEKYLAQISLKDEPIESSILFRAHDLQQILERMELSLAGTAGPVTRGLGIHNILFIAAELLALGPGGEPDLPLVLIEEPEAHLHPQLQLRLIEYIRSQSKTAPSSPATQIQTVLTTHSPNLASKIPLESMVFMNQGRAYRMGPSHTKLDSSDYKFLERFLDVTKANLFFATGVLVVEGDAEALLLPAIADNLERSLTEHGVSIVNVGHTGLFRYSRIFQRRDGEAMPVSIACLADRDIPPKEAKPYLSATRKTEDAFTNEEIAAKVTALKRNDGGSVRTFVSPLWTLEYDLACTPLAPYVHAAVSLAVASKQAGCQPTGEAKTEIIAKALAEHAQWVEAGKSINDIACLIYEPLLTRNASKPEAAQCLAQLIPNITDVNVRTSLPDYLVSAINFVTGGDAAAAAPAA